MAWRRRVVVVGGGFGGIAVARGLAREPVDILLLDKTNHHLFQPLLYQVATCALSPAEIAVPIRQVFAGQKNVEVLFTDVTEVNLKARRLETTSGPVDYHFLVLAAGARNNYFGHDDWPRHAVGLKTLDEALEVRRKVLMALELAEQETDPARRRELLTFVVIGGGPTGVEMAGALSELSRNMVTRDFRHTRPEEISVVLIEGGPSVLGTFSEPMRRSAMKQLLHLQVEVRPSSRVIAIGPEGLTVQPQDGEPQLIPAANVLWAAGVQAAALGSTLGVPLDRGGRVVVDRQLNVPGYEEVFCIGDMASCSDANGVAVPGVAPAATQMGRFVARQIERRLQGLKAEEFRYVNKGNLATIGRSAAVAEFRHLKLSGLPAWLLWLGVHIAFLIGFRNRYVVFFQWVWAYLTFQRGARLITGRPADFRWPSQPRRLTKRKKRVDPFAEGRDSMAPVSHAGDTPGPDADDAPERESTAPERTG
ncbi:MAG TPA: NAD(P)/FAD-dependent oxidoreductase [Polyangiaceae bacterium]|nr:NAD(P)/FAD-dependent oxidoreductase [Polyangiaceae bacterium]